MITAKRLETRVDPVEISITVKGPTRYYVRNSLGGWRMRPSPLTATETYALEAEDAKFLLEAITMEKLNV